jgi:hypothetical protein
MIAWIKLAQVGTAIRVRWQPATGYGQYFRVVCDGVKQLNAVRVADGQTGDLLVEPNQSETHHTVIIVPQGECAGNVDVSAQQSYFDAAITDRINVAVVPTLDIFSYDCADQLDTWALTGLARGVNCRSYNMRRNWAALDVTLTTVGATRTLNLSLGSQVMASGTISTGATLPATITLTAQNSSGLASSVRLASYTADITAGVVAARYPVRYDVHYKTSAFLSGDFPRTAELSIYDDGKSAAFYAQSTKLTAGTYRVVVRVIDEDGNESTNLDSGGASVVITAAPASPGVPVYAAGGASDTEVQFAASATAGATYNVYDSLATGLLDETTVAHTHAAGIGTLSQVLAAIAGTFTGTRYVLVRSVSGGIEDRNIAMLAIEYVSGVVVSPKPPIPVVVGEPTVVGRTITLPLTIDTRDQGAVAATIKLFAFDPDSSPNYASPSASVAMVTAASNGLAHGSISYTAPSDAYLQFAVRTQAATGIQSPNTDSYGPFALTTTPLSAPTTTVSAGY